ncbi:MAG: hypothetical protein QGF99_05735 [Acidimicrobiales bacterium]|jgi:hypothetical protein|nr:hypothetical protein [Acidimicrobiales bacterium]MDP6901473.1 hypothetical protein [Acidimicrobiales bacterium]
MKRFFIVTLSLVLLTACSSAPNAKSGAGDSQTTTTISGNAATDESQPTESTMVAKPPELIQLEDAWDSAASRPGADIGQVFQLFRLKQSLGPKNLACYDPDSGDVCEQIVEAIDVVGLTELQLTLLLDSLELPHRVIERDCEPLMVTEEFVAGRVNFSVFEGVVTGWASEGGKSSWAGSSC